MKRQNVTIKRGRTALWRVYIPLLAILITLLVPSRARALDTIPDNAADWTDRGTVLLPGPSGSWDELESGFKIMDIYKVNGTYFLYYQGARDECWNPGHMAVGLATSTDGINFTKYAGNPILVGSDFNPTVNSPEEALRAIAVLNVNPGSWLMYLGVEFSAQTGCDVAVDSFIYAATSSDGYDWTPLGEVDGVNNEIGQENYPDCIEIVGDTYYAWTHRAQGGYMLFGSKGTDPMNMNPVGWIPELDFGWQNIDSYLHDDNNTVTLLYHPKSKDGTSPNCYFATTYLTDITDIENVRAVFPASESSKQCLLRDDAAGEWKMYYGPSDYKKIGLRTAPRPVADTTPPALVSAFCGGAGTEVTVTFSEPVEQASAQTTGNYAIDNGVSISSAVLQGDLVTVKLTTSAHAEGPTYTLTVDNVRDRATSPNTILADSQLSYRHISQVEISNINRAGDGYTSGTLAVGELVYFDRTYTFTDVALLGGKTYILTANDDKLATDAVFLSFDVNIDVMVYVGYDEEYAQAGWLASWTDEGAGINSTDNGGLKLYSKQFPAGTVSLPGNQYDGGAGHSMYSVIITGAGVPQPDTTPPSVAISSPTSADTYSTDQATVALGGTASDDTGVVSVTWVNDQGGSGTASGVGPWTISSVDLAEGDNVITVTVEDEANNEGTDVITVTYTPPVPDTTPPVISGVGTSGANHTGATIAWTTDEPATSTVEYGPDASYGDSVSDSVLKTSHSMVLGGLQAETTYHYRVRSTDGSDNEAVGTDRTFTTDAVPSVLIISGVDPLAYELGTLAVGELVYVDRDYQFTDVADLAGEQYIRTANDDKLATDAVLLSFDVNTDVTVYVGYDERDVQAGWLASWTDEGAGINSTDRGGMNLYSKQFPTGTVSLPGNQYDGGAGHSMYSVVIKTAGTPPLPDTQAPSVPQNLSAAAPVHNRVDLSWDASTDNVGVTGYEIYRDGALIDTVAGTSVSDDTVVAETAYNYTVLAFDAAGNSSAQSAAANVTTPEAPEVDLEVTVLQPGGYEPALIGVGDVYYTDRTYQIASIPASYGGMTWIMTANDDKNSTASGFVQFTVNRDTTVIVGHDQRLSSYRPTWLTSAFNPTGDVITDNSGVTFNLYSMAVSAGTVSLGGNEGPFGSCNMYIVLVGDVGGAPQAAPRLAGGSRIDWDRTPPSVVGGFAGESDRGEISIAWKESDLQSDEDVHGYLVLRGRGSAAPVDGWNYAAGERIGDLEVVSTGQVWELADKDLGSGVHLYTIYAFDGMRNYSQPAQLEVVVFAGGEVVMLRNNFVRPGMNTEMKVNYLVGNDFSPVSIEVHDIMGRKVATLAEGNAETGLHEASWNASDAASGMYFIRVKVGEDLRVLRAMVVR